MKEKEGVGHSRQGTPRFYYIHCAPLQTAIIASRAPTDPPNLPVGRCGIEFQVTTRLGTRLPRTPRWMVAASEARVTCQRLVDIVRGDDAGLGTAVRHPS